MPLTLYNTFAWQTFASLRLFTSLVYVSTYCVPIAHLRQNKPFLLLYLGHAQIIIVLRIEKLVTVSTIEFWVIKKVQYVVLCIVKTHSDTAADAEAGDHGKACHVVNKHIL